MYAGLALTWAYRSVSQSSFNCACIAHSRSTPPLPLCSAAFFSLHLAGRGIIHRHLVPLVLAAGSELGLGQSAVVSDRDILLLSVASYGGLTVVSERLVHRTPHSRRCLTS